MSAEDDTGNAFRKQTTWLSAFDRAVRSPLSVGVRTWDRLRQDGFFETARLARRYIRRLGMVHGYLPLLRVISEDGLEAREVDGRTMFLDLGDPGLSRRLLVIGEHEPGIESVWRTALSEGMVVVDIGSNFGYYSLMAAEQVGEDGHVHAIEPVPSNYDLLRRNVAANSFENVSTHNLAVGSSNGTETMYLTDASNWGTLLEWDGESRTSAYMAEKMERQTRETIDVETATLPAFVEEHDLETIDAFRMDIEGYEVEVTRGMTDLLDDVESPCWAFIEVHNKHFDDYERVVSDLIETYEACGFRPHSLFLGNEPIPVDGDFLEKLLSYNDACPHVVMKK